MPGPPAPSIYNINYTSLATTQEGYHTPSIADWRDETTPIFFLSMTEPRITTIGLQFLLFDPTAVVNLPLLSNFTLRLTPSGLPSSGTITVYMVPETNPARFSLASPPFSRGETASHIVGQIVQPLSGNTRLDIDLDLDIIRTIVYNHNFSGTLALSLDWTNSTGPFAGLVLFGVSTSATPPDLTVGEVPFNTGMMVGGDQIKRRARVVHSYKSGFPYLSDEAIEDGDLEGIMLHPDDYDPEDPVASGRGDYVQSPTEGVVDDDVTDLEG